MSVVQCTAMETRRVEILRSKGVHPANPRAGCVPGFALRIGQRATLMPSSQSSAYGIIMELCHAEVEKLYSEPSVSAYRAEAVMVQLADGSYIPALCFNVVVPPAPEEAKSEYAAKLRELAGRLRLPRGHVEGIG